METDLWRVQLPQHHQFNRIYEEWKPVLSRFRLVSRFSFNRIYEEWKLNVLQSYHPLTRCSIESMRNGNFYCVVKLAVAGKFNRIYEEWKLYSGRWAFRSQKKFNRIYEEWKQSMTNIPSAYGISFNRIYEEWKLDSVSDVYSQTMSFNRIYEEWKQRIAHRGQEPPKGSIESMRNGNSSNPQQADLAH